MIDVPRRKTLGVTAPLLAAVALLLAAALYTTRGWPSALRVEEPERGFDLVIFGATGYVGSLLTASLLGDARPFLSIAPGVRLNSGTAGVRFALAARNASAS